MKTTTMPYQGKMSLEEALKGSNHPFAEPGITFVPRQTTSPPPAAGPAPATEPNPPPELISQDQRKRSAP